MSESAEYHSKPMTVEAVEITEANITEVAAWCDGRACLIGRLGVQVPTINGVTFAAVGHFVVKGLTDFYPCDPETFASRWERADPVDTRHPGPLGDGCGKRVGDYGVCGQEFVMPGGRRGRWTCPSCAQVTP